MVKRTLIIGAGIFLLLLVLGVWIYLMLFGSPQNGGDVFSNLGFTPAVRETTDSDYPNNPVDIVDYTVDVSPEALKQLTTKAVAGFTSFDRASTTHIRYVERGTGHIYEINLRTGEESMISRTTIPKVLTATFSPSGTAVAITSLNGYQTTTAVGTIIATTTSLQSETLPPNAENIALLRDDAVRYTYIQDDTLRGYEKTLGGAVRELFVTPMYSIRTIWSDSATWFYNRPAPSLPGYLYEVTSGSFTATPLTGYGLVVDHLGSYFGVSEYQNNSINAYFFDRVTNTQTVSPIGLIPEKCTIRLDEVFCGAPLTSIFSIDDWYKGIEASDDYLWQISPLGNQAILLANLKELANRPLDVTNLEMEVSSTALLFINKTDGALWRYDLTL